MCLIYPPKDLKFGLIQNETSIVDLFPSQGCSSSDLGCQYVKNLHMESINLVISIKHFLLLTILLTIFSQISFSTEEEALQNVLDGSIWGYLTLPSDFQVWNLSNAQIQVKMDAASKEFRQNIFF
jgi:hypothetical protein